MRRDVRIVGNDLKWAFGGSKESDLPWIWCECAAWRRMPKWLCGPVNVIYNVRGGKADVYYDPQQMGSCSKRIIEAFLSDPSAIERFISDLKVEHSKLKQVAADIGGLNLSALSDVILHKIYLIILTQYTELSKYNNVIRAVSKDDQLIGKLSEKSVTKDSVSEVLEGAARSSSGLFGEISRRIQKKADFVMAMTPEEMHVALSGGQFEEWEAEERQKHYMLVYDLEKDDPHVYTGEKSRTMEASFGFKGIPPKPQTMSSLDLF